MDDAKRVQEIFNRRFLRTPKQYAQAVEDTIKDVGTKKPTDERIEAACKKNNTNERTVRVVAGWIDGATRAYHYNEEEL